MKAMAATRPRWEPAADGGLWADFPDDSIVKVDYRGLGVWGLVQDGTTLGVGSLQVILKRADEKYIEESRRCRQHAMRSELARLQNKDPMTLREQKRIHQLIKKLPPEA